MAFATTANTTTTISQPLDGDDAPKWRVEHSVSDKATCNQAACKRAGVKIAKGELRLGTQAWWEDEQKYYRQWRHWGCATKAQIEGLKTLSGDNPDDIPGYVNLSPESQEQVRLALEEGKVPDKEFKDIRSDLVKFVGGASGEIRNAVGYKVEKTTRGSAGCRNDVCKGQGIKILKGELRLGIATMWDGEHMTWVYKHWKCITQLDLTSAMGYYEDDSLDGLETLPEEYRSAVLETFETGEVVVPPMTEAETTSKSKKPRAPRKSRVPRKNKADAEENGESIDDEIYGEVDEAVNLTLKSRKKRSADGVDSAGGVNEPVRKKKRSQATKQDASGKEDDSAAEEPPLPVSRAKMAEIVDPKVAEMEALTARLRAEASR